MKILLRTHELAPDGDEGAAIMEVTRELVERLRKLVEKLAEMKAADSMVASITVLDFPLNVYDGYLAGDALYDDGYIGEEAASQWDSQQWCVLPDDFDAEQYDVEHGERTECERLHVSGDDRYGIMWSWVRKHCDFYTESQCIGIADLEALLAAAT